MSRIGGVSKDLGMGEYDAEKSDLYEDPEVKGADGKSITTRVLTIMLAEEY